ncbi:activator-dependent family glycosyltransferase [Dactylosporangium sp. AC04546]|uniref:activator-dependent family glycosyltransferase n=1 Tax=Dactylosporangium sp. AC04546 TaxID=2862460 RepID=UPI001EDD8C76|nr:activator-dependent family glycosyltransferase [Dactylosporangium sp. AC04546]WVK79053.1 activator-dependent family glycosyltransferase [Dactylosporangium sp. AC04546]
MRVLFTTVAQSTHLYNQVPLAWAMHTAGHEVCIASHPSLEHKIVQTGLTAVPVGAPLPPARRLTMADFAYPEPRPAELDWEYMLGKFAVFSGLMFPFYEPETLRNELVDFARAWRPDLVVWDMFSFAGAAAAAACGAAHARILFGLDLVGQMRRMFLDLMAQQPQEARDDPLAEWLSWILPRFGGEFGEDLVVGQWTVDPMPAAMRLPVAGHYEAMRYVSYHGPAPVPAWVREPAERPRVCLTLGLTAREGWDVSKVPVDELFEAVADLDAEVVATLSAEQIATLGSRPANVRLVEFVPLHALLPSCAAVIHHGGTGTFGTAIVHGVPQVIVPHGFWDTSAKAEYVAANGAGVHLTDFSAGALRSALLDVLGGGFGAGAGRVRDDMRAQPSPNDLVPVLERLSRR